MAGNCSQRDPRLFYLEEVRKERNRLNQRIRRLKARIERGQEADSDIWVTSEMYEDLDNWTGWRDALNWVLKMSRGRTTRKAAWGED